MNQRLNHDVHICICSYVDVLPNINFLVTAEKNKESSFDVSTKLIVKGQAPAITLDPTLQSEFGLSKTFRVQIKLSPTRPPTQDQLYVI